ncbi:hypothetical protein ACN20G_02745 [Streptomyces sp. BI20]|uniref:hypothetical protein n=1 Tax=Streptomyces sp. BI20 TaxID=3403460 RepID=UPI003C78A7E5
MSAPLEMYAWPGTADGPDALPLVHFTTERLAGDEVTEDGQPVWILDAAIRDGGWSLFSDFEGWAVPADDWMAEYRLAEDLLVLSGPGACAGWYQGTLGAPEDWVRAADGQRSLVLLAAPVQHPSQFGHAVDAGAAFALLVPLNVV